MRTARARSASTSASRVSPWSALTCSSMSLICSSAPSAAIRMFTTCDADVRRRVRAQQLLGARDHDLQRRAHVVRELAEQALAVVVDAGEPLRQRRQLRVLARQPLLDPLAVGDRPALGDDERDAPVARPQRPDREVQRAGLAAGDADPDVEAREPPFAPPRRPPRWTIATSSRPAADHHGVIHSGRPSDLGEIDAAGDQRRRIDVEHVPAGVEQRHEVRGLGQRDLRHQLPRHAVLVRRRDLGDARAQRLHGVERRAPVIRAFLLGVMRRVESNAHWCGHG